MLEIASVNDLPECITRAHVAAEAARYPRPLDCCSKINGAGRYTPRGDGGDVPNTDITGLPRCSALPKQVAVVTRQ